MTTPTTLDAMSKRAHALSSVHVAPEAGLRELAQIVAELCKHAADTHPNNSVVDAEVVNEDGLAVIGAEPDDDVVVSSGAIRYANALDRMPAGTIIYNTPRGTSDVNADGVAFFLRNKADLWDSCDGSGAEIPDLPEFRSDQIFLPAYVHGRAF